MDESNSDDEIFESETKETMGIEDIATFNQNYEEMKKCII